MTGQDLVARARYRLTVIEDEHYFLDDETAEINTFLRVLQRLSPEHFQSPPGTTPPAKTGSDRRSGDVGGQSFQESEAGPRPEGEVVTPLSDASVTRVAAPGEGPEAGASDPAGEAHVALASPVTMPHSSAPALEQALDGSRTELISPSDHGQGVRDAGGAPNSPETATQSTAARMDGQQAGTGRDGDSESARVEDVISLGARSQPTWKERVGQGVAPAGTQAPSVDTESQAKTSTGNADTAEAPDEGGTVMSGEASRSSRADGGPAPLSPPTIAQRIAAHLQIRPQDNAYQIGETIGVDPHLVAVTARKNNLPVRKLTTDERGKLVRDGAKKAAQNKPPGPMKFVRTDPPAAKPEVASEPAPQPFDVGDDEEEVFTTRPRGRPPKGLQFRLRQGVGEGKYLHQTGIGLVQGWTYAWKGSEAQLLKLRQKFPDAKELREELVEVSK